MKALLLPIALFLVTSSVFAAPLKPNGFVESEQPFLRSALIVSEGPTNRVRRGVLLSLGHDLWTCFDPDLLRYAAVWKAPQGVAPLSMDSMAGISYPDAKAKADKVPKLNGELLAASPELPGIGNGQLPDTDKRVGTMLVGTGKIGPMPAGAGRYLGLVLSREKVIVSYRVAGRIVRETTRAVSPDQIERLISVQPGSDVIAIGLDGAEGKNSMTGKKGTVQLASGGMPHLEIEGTAGFVLKSDGTTGTYLVVTGGKKESVFRILRSSKVITATEPLGAFPEYNPAKPAFPETVEVTSPRAKESGAPIIATTLGLPQENPWKRTLRPTDIAFLSNGEALITTLDGDVWRVKNIGADTATWSRAASGIFEPMSIAINGKDQVFVLGRDQITRLEDSDGDGYFDVYACASDAFLQTLHTRDYATALEIEEDGSFLISRSGLMDFGKGKYSETTVDRGCVIRISPNGLEETILADGLRLPFVGRRADGTVFASDQQGNYVPSTPIHRIGGAKTYLGYEPANSRKEKDLASPLLWFPYQINRSGSSFATLSEKAFPSLGNAFVHLSWSGRIFPIVTPKAGLPFAWKLPADFDFPILGGATHPSNGRLYVTGIGISGYSPQTPKILGLAEIREGAPMVAPQALEVSEESITVSFRNPLPPAMSLIAPRPELNLWNIKRTKDYGSGHYRWDEKPGEHAVNTGKLTVSEDRRKVTIAVPPIFRSEILRLRLHFRDTATNRESYMIELYARPDSLQVATPADLVKVSAREKEETVAMTPGDKGTGETLFKNYGCVGCHSLDGAKLTGPPLNGIATRHKDGLDDYLKTSILEPTAVITEGYEPSMPSFAGVIPEQNIAHIVAYLKSLK